MEKPKVDQDLCIACGNCVSINPEVFELKGPDGKSQIKKLSDYESYGAKISKAIEGCPVKAIS